MQQYILLYFSTYLLSPRVFISSHSFELQPSLPLPQTKALPLAFLKGKFNGNIITSFLKSENVFNF
jgi:hypothetical protein